MGTRLREVPGASLSFVWQGVVTPLAGYNLLPPKFGCNPVTTPQIVSDAGTMVRDEAIMLKNSSFMLCWNASNYAVGVSLLCSCSKFINS